MSLRAVLEILARRNKLDPGEKNDLDCAVAKVVQALPPPGEEELFIQAHSKWASTVGELEQLTSLPGAGLAGHGPATASYDGCFLTWMRGTLPRFMKRLTSRRLAFEFKEKGAENLIALWLSLPEVKELTSKDWRLFGRACQIAANARHTRGWISNVRVTERPWRVHASN